MSKTDSIKWAAKPAEDDYPSAYAYLSLVYGKKSGKLLEKLRKARVTRYTAKDILRASRLSVLNPSEAHVTRDQQKIVSGEKLSPILLVQDAAARRVFIADGYHRMCAVYLLDPDAVVPCKIVWV